MPVPAYVSARGFEPRLLAHGLTLEPAVYQFDLCAPPKASQHML